MKGYWKTGGASLVNDRIRAIATGRRDPDAHERWTNVSTVRLSYAGPRETRRSRAAEHVGSVEVHRPVLHLCGLTRWLRSLSDLAGRYLVM
jgi:hypothetical protein